MNIFKQGIIIDACDMPNDVEDWCIDNEISTHYQGDVISLDITEDNPFVEWLRNNNLPTEAIRGKYISVGIIPT